MKELLPHEDPAYINAGKAVGLEIVAPPVGITIVVGGQPKGGAPVEVDTNTEDFSEKFKTLRKYMYTDEGEFKLSNTQHQILWGMCNGYGDMDIETLAEMELFGDWSHVRDSHPDTLVEVYDCLRAMIIKWEASH